jgi:small subunit ribosomal protein S16
MSLKIRLARGGKKKDPHYYVVVSPSTSPRDSGFIEKIGHYHPKQSGDTSYTLDQVRLDYWISVGAKPTDRIAKVMKSKYPSLEKFYKAPVINPDKLNKSKKDLKKQADEMAAAYKKMKAEKLAAEKAAAVASA